MDRRAGAGDESWGPRRLSDLAPNGTAVAAEDVVAAFFRMDPRREDSGPR